MPRSAGVSSLFLSLLCLAAPLCAQLKSFPAATLKPADPSADILFVVGGDNRSTAPRAPLPRVLKTIFSEISLIRPDFVFWTGDVAYGYCDTKSELEQEYEDFRAIAQPIAGVIPLFNAPGNHEIHGGPAGCKTKPEPFCGAEKGAASNCSEMVFQDHFGELYGSFDYAGAHFIALDSEIAGEEDSISGKQLKWLTDDLELHKGARAIFVFTHTEFYSSPQIDKGAGNSHPAMKNRAALQDLFRAYPVRAVFSGHEHLFSHEPPEQHDGIEYFVVGGAGAPLYATPDRGGFSHYMVVRLTGSDVSYLPIEPGRLYVEDRCKPDFSPPPPKGECPEKGAAFWIINSNDLVSYPACSASSQPTLSLRGIEFDAPSGLGDCAKLTVTAESFGFDKITPVQGFALDCAASTGGKLYFKSPPIHQESIRVTVKSP
jgi:hypothetical protein